MEQESQWTEKALHKSKDVLTIMEEVKEEEAEERKAGLQSRQINRVTRVETSEETAVTAAAPPPHSHAPSENNDHNNLINQFELLSQRLGVEEQVRSALHLVRTALEEAKQTTYQIKETLEADGLIAEAPLEKNKHRRTMSHMGKFMVITEIPTNRMIATGMLIFERDETKMNHEVFKRIIEDRVVSKYSRFRSLVSEEYNEFIDLYDKFNIEEHFHREYLTYSKEDGDMRSDEELEEEALRHLLSDIISRPLNRSLPLWEVVTIDNYSKGFIALWRIHHCIGDGTSLAAVISEMSDDPKTLKQFKTLKEKYTPKHKENWFTNTRLAKAIYFLIFLLLLIIGCLRILLKWTIEIYKGPDPRTIFKGELTTEKVVGLQRKKIRLEDIKEVGALVHGTINDVAMTCFAGALDRYAKQKKQEVKRQDIRLSIPVNIRTNLHEMLTPSNKFGFIVCKLPLGITDPVARLRLISKQMNYNKQLPEQYFSYYVGLITGFLPKQFVRNTFNLLSTYQTTVLTNVRGPSEQLTMNGAKLIDIAAFAPQPGGVALGALVVSYNGYLNVTMVADANVIPDVQLLTQYFCDEFQELHRIAKASKN